MTILKNLFILKRLKFPIYTKSAMCTKFYSDTGCYKKKTCLNKNPGDPKLILPDKEENDEKKMNKMKAKTKLSCKNTIKLAIIGGGYATVCATILLKQNPAIKEIALIDTDNSLSGAVCDIRQIDTSTTIKHYKKNSIIEGLRHSDIVALMDETDFSIGDRDPLIQFKSSSSYVRNVAECLVGVCPAAIIAVFARPVTATLPLVSKIYRQSGRYDPNRIVGSVAIESMRIAAMTANLLDLNASYLSVPISGGVDSLTVVPLLSRTRPFNNFSEDDLCILTHQLRSADKKLREFGKKAPTLSSGAATAKFVSTIINGFQEKSIAIACAYVRSDIFSHCQYITSEVRFGPTGVVQNFGLPKVSSKELHLIERAVPIINETVDTVDHFLECLKS